MKEVSSGRRRLAPDARRRQLLEVGLSLLDRDPHGPLTAKSIAGAAGTVPGLLYRYFPDLGAFAKEVLDATAARLAEAAPTAGADDPLRASLRGELGFAARHPGLWRALHDRTEAIEARRRWLARLEAELSRARGTGPLSPRARIQLRGWLGLRRATIEAWLEDPGITQEALVDLLTEAAAPWLLAQARPRDRKPRIRLMGAGRPARRAPSGGVELGGSGEPRSPRHQDR